MSQFKRLLSLGLMLSVIGILPTVTFAVNGTQPGVAEWDNLKSLVEGQEIKVVLKNVKSYRGQLLSVSGEAIRVALPTGPVTFTRDEILRVSYKTGTHHGRNALIGTAIGAGAGAVAFGAGDPHREVIPGGAKGAAIGAILFAPLGAAVGAVLPSEAWRDVYRAR